MGTEDTHYQVLGVAENATTAEIEGAVAQLAHVASALALSAPAQADALWLRIRQISRDLLSGEERRRMYDRSLRARGGREKTGGPGAPAVMPVAMGDAVRPRTVAPASTRRRSARGGWRGGAADLGVALLVMAAVAVLFLQPWNWGHSSPTTPPLALSASGPQLGNAYRSGDTVTLHWTSAGPGAIYQVQIGRGGALLDRTIAFLPPWRSILTERTVYRFRAVGAQFYFWRVRPMVAGRWQQWSAPVPLAVAAPHVPAPAPAAGDARTVVRPGDTRLCWSAVANADGYVVLVDSRRPIVTRSRCIRVRLTAGTHTWRVAATTRGVRLYVGPFSAPAMIRAVRAQHPARIDHRRPVAVTGPVARSGQRSGSGPAGVVFVAPPNEVAVVSAPAASVSTRPAAHRSGHKGGNPPSRATTPRVRRSSVSAPVAHPGGTATRIPAPQRLPAARSLPRTNRGGPRSNPGGSLPVIPAPPPPPPSPTPIPAASTPTDQGQTLARQVAVIPAAPAPTPTAKSSGRPWAVPPTPLP